MKNGANNSVICYGLDETGNYFPLSTTSSANYSSYSSLSKLYSSALVFNSGVGSSQAFNIPAADGKRVFVHGVQITLSQDADGNVPLQGLYTDAYVSALTIDVGGQIVVFGGGQVADLINIAGTSGLFMTSPGNLPAFFSGVIPVNKLINAFSSVFANANSVDVVVTADIECYGRVRMVYSLVDA